MIHRGFALLGVIALSLPAHASLIEYSFTATLCGCNFNSENLPYSAFGLENGDTITGGFLFDDAAPLTGYSEQSMGVFGVLRAATYDMSNLLLWASVGDHLLNATGDSLTIVDAAPNPSILDRWGLTTRGDGREVNGYTVAQISMSTRWLSPIVITSVEPYVLEKWPFTTIDPSLNILFTDGSRIAAHMRTITGTSVPEPATLSLLAAGALGGIRSTEAKARRGQRLNRYRSRETLVTAPLRTLSRGSGSSHRC
jgi:hypothetical protein